jgi:hypothetical protein
MVLIVVLLPILVFAMFVCPFFRIDPQWRQRTATHFAPQMQIFTSTSLPHTKIHGYLNLLRALACVFYCERNICGVDKSTNLFFFHQISKINSNPNYSSVV